MAEDDEEINRTTDIPNANFFVKHVWPFLSKHADRFAELELKKQPGIINFIFSVVIFMLCVTVVFYGFFTGNTIQILAPIIFISLEVLVSMHISATVIKHQEEKQAINKIQFSPSNNTN